MSQQRRAHEHSVLSGSRKRNPTLSCCARVRASDLLICEVICAAQYRMISECMQSHTHSLTLLLCQLGTPEGGLRCECVAATGRAGEKDGGG